MLSEFQSPYCEYQKSDNTRRYQSRQISVMYIAVMITQIKCTVQEFLAVLDNITVTYSEYGRYFKQLEAFFYKL